MSNQVTQEQQVYEGTRGKRDKWLAWGFFPAALLYHELLLHAFDASNSFFGAALLPIVLFSVAGGLFLRLLLAPLPGLRLRRIVSGIICGLWTVLVGTEYCLKSYFKIYFGIGYIFHMTDQVVGDFGGTMVEVIAARIPFILLDLIPFVCLMIWGRRMVENVSVSRRLLVVLAAVMVLCQGLGSLWGNLGTDKKLYRWNYTTDAAVPRFGLLSAVRLEGEYAIFGTPQAEMAAVSFIDNVATDHPARVLYDYNVMDLDLTGIAEETSSSALRSALQYFSGRVATQKNEYTGMFAGKNLILITAESFSPYVISEELTPTLYKLTHSGFVFTDFYQPGWGQSTTGGEFAVMTGVIPTWINNNLSFYVSSKDDMPFALGNQFSKLGYTTQAYHNNTYDYYDRDLTHPNLGYDYHGVGTGITVSDPSEWPYSDLELVQQTLPDIIENSKSTGTPFHTYYMTVSGHANWTWSHAMAALHKEEVQAAYPDASQTVQCYIAANLELEAALTYMLEQLEAAGILDDTVICMAADHYPYAMVTETEDYYNELRGFSDTEKDASRFQNTLILWNSAMDTVTVTTPCSAIDIVPTLSNLFGLEFDSRLLSGHDIFAANYAANRVSSNMPLVILPGPDGATMSWITAAGYYNAYTGEFTPQSGVLVDDDYVQNVCTLVELQYNYAKSLIQYDMYGVLLGDTAADGHEVVAPAPQQVETEETEETEDTGWEAVEEPQVTEEPTPPEA